jgi:hypothetical protein
LSSKGAAALHLRSYLPTREEFLPHIESTDDQKAQISHWITWAGDYADSLDPSNRTLQDFGWEK